MPRGFVGIYEIAAALGVSRQRADQITRERDFPQPVEVLHMGRVWRKREFEEWRKRHGREDKTP